MRLLVLFACLSGCAGTFRSVNEKDPAEVCLADSRAELQIYGNPDRAWDFYLACREQLRERP